jgi:hypothetical protein
LDSGRNTAIDGGTERAIRLCEACFGEEFIWLTFDADFGIRIDSASLMQPMMPSQLVARGQSHACCMTVRTR